MNFTELLPWCHFVVWPSGINLSICNDCKSSIVWYLIWVLPVCLEAERVPAGRRRPWQSVIHTCRLSCSLPSAGNGRGTQHPCRQGFLSSAAVWWDQRDSDKDLRSSWLCWLHQASSKDCWVSLAVLHHHLGVKNSSILSLGPCK